MDAINCINDNRPEIKENTIFNDNGDFKVDLTTEKKLVLKNLLKFLEDYIMSGVKSILFHRIFPHLHTQLFMYNFLDKT